MDAIRIKIIIDVLLLLILVGTGIVLRRTGHPYKIFPVTVHKIIALGAIVLTWIIISYSFKTDSAYNYGLATRIFTIILVVSSLITGAVLSSKKDGPMILKSSHKIISYFVILLIIYKLFSNF